ncbi:MAG TPA: MFS transporter [Acidobacteriaceae bacterium]|nr:MFS transporter [Acidobacteriaceae bacterium]
MLIFAAVVAIFIYGMIAAMLGTILPELSDRFHLTPHQNGIIAFAQALGLILASLAVGPLLDNEGKKIGLILGLAFIAATLALLPRSSGFRSVVFLLFLLGIGGGIVVTGANSLASDIDAAHRATALNLVNLFFGLGAFATPFISANLFKQNWVRLCYSVAVLAAITLGIQFATRMPPPSGSGRFILADAGPVLGHPALFLFGFYIFLYFTCEIGVWNWLVRHLIAQGIPEQHALNILSLGFALGLIVGRLGISAVLLRASALNVTLVASIAMVFTTFFMIRTSRPAVAFTLVFLAGLSMAPVFPTILAIVGGAFPRMTSTAMGIVITCGYIGLAVSSRIIGSIAGGDPKRLRKALLVIPAASVIMVGLNIAIRFVLP